MQAPNARKTGRNPNIYFVPCFGLAAEYGKTPPASKARRTGHAA
ncbi:hypothetical protein APS_0694 [Acetobacter pasteurianus subsp. pasteurianus LMG 1262 = NBRC 106471]|nr:hypothetical protein APS_0694 [Acetobacter pasteurianus subsp. pasteurianus LMG 1262 = NBRC 106471]